MIGLHVLEPGFSVYSQHQSAIGERVLSYDHTYLARLGVPNALLDKAGEGLCSLPLEERRIVYNHLFNSATLRAQFNKIVRSFGFSDETRDELWAAGFALLFEKNASYISYKYLFGDEGKNNGVFKGLMVAEKRTRNKVAERTLSLDQPFAAEGGVTLGDSLVAEVQRSTLEDSDFLDEVKALLSQRRSDAQDAYWQVFVWTYVVPLTPKELADKLSCTVNTASNRRHRLRKILLTWLAWKYPELLEREPSRGENV